MVKWLHKLLFVAISISFFISATEMDLGECHNTFFDEYDTYVKTEQVSVGQMQIQQQQQELLALASLFYHYYLFAATQTFNYPSSSYQVGNISPPKLFLRNSVWRI